MSALRIIHATQFRDNKIVEYPVVVKDLDTPVARFFCQYGETAPIDITLNEATANAHLFAASSLMLHSLELAAKALAHHENHWAGASQSYDYKMIMRAIAKAKGK